MKKKSKFADSKFGQISAKLVGGLPTWSLKPTLNLPQFSFRENSEKRFLAAYYLWWDYNRL